MSMTLEEAYSRYDALQQTGHVPVVKVQVNGGHGYVVKCLCRDCAQMQQSELPPTVVLGED